MLALTDGKRLEVLPRGRGSQDDLRRRSRPEHRRHGHGLAGVDRATTCSRADHARDPRADRARPRRRRHRLPRRALRRRDGRRGRRAVAARVQLPVRRSRDPADHGAAWCGDLGAVLLGAARGEMPVGALAWDARVAVCVVVAAAGYPGDGRAPAIRSAALDRSSATMSSCSTPAPRARTARSSPAGGRVLGVTALGVSVAAGARAGLRGVDRDRARGQAGPPRHRRRGAAVIRSAHAAHRWVSRSALGPSKVAREVVVEPIDAKDGLAAASSFATPTRAVYRYHQMFAAGGRTVTRKTLALRGAARAVERGRDPAARGDRSPTARDAALAAIRAAGGHTEPVLAGYRDAASEVDRVFRKVESERPTLEVTTPDGTQHRLWRVAERRGDRQAAHAVRAEEAARARRSRALRGDARVRERARASEPLACTRRRTTALACLVNLDDPALVVAARHRIIAARRRQARRACSTAAQAVLHRREARRRGEGRREAARGARRDRRAPAGVRRVFAGDPDAWKLTLVARRQPGRRGRPGPSRDRRSTIRSSSSTCSSQRLLPARTSTTELDAAGVLAAGRERCRGRHGHAADAARADRARRRARRSCCRSARPRSRRRSRTSSRSSIDPDEDLVYAPKPPQLDGLVGVAGVRDRLLLRRVEQRVHHHVLIVEHADRAAVLGEHADVAREQHEVADLRERHRLAGASR